MTWQIDTIWTSLDIYTQGITRTRVCLWNGIVWLPLWHRDGIEMIKLNTWIPDWNCRRVHAAFLDVNSLLFSTLWSFHFSIIFFASIQVHLRYWTLYSTILGNIQTMSLSNSLRLTQGTSKTPSTLLFCATKVPVSMAPAKYRPQLGISWAILGCGHAFAGLFENEVYHQIDR